jgi:hypothetical protein
VPAFVTFPVVEFETSACVTVDGEAPGFVCRYSAIAPATCGDAIEVPLMVFVAVLLVDQAEVMLDPGANMSRHDP